MKLFARFVSCKLYPYLVVTLLIAVCLFWKSAPHVKSAKEDGENNELKNYDIRADKSGEEQKNLEKFISESGKNHSLIAAEVKNGRRAAEESKTNKRWQIEYNENLRTPEIIASEISKDGNFLTSAGGGNRVANLRHFLRENSALFGLDEIQINSLETTADYTNPNGVLSFVHFAQKIGGIPVFRGEVKAGFTRRGEMFRVINNLVPALDYQNLKLDFGNPETAVVKAAKSINITVTENDLKKIEAASDDLKITFERGRFADKTTAEKIYFPVDYAVARTAWRVLLWTNTDAFYVIVDAQTGTLLWRKNITERQTLPATFNVYGNSTSMMQTADSPTPCTPGCNDPNNCPQPPVIARQTFTLVGNESPDSFNNLGWIPDGGLPVRTPADPNITDGNNCEAGIDRDGTTGVDPLGHAAGNPFRVFNYSYNPAPGNPSPGDDPVPPNPQPYPPTAFQQGVATHGFYLVNRWHDEMYKLGFTESAGNFQHFNFGRGGVEGDRISLEIQDSSGTNGANFATPADGGRGRMQMFIWTGSTPARDGNLDSTVVVHEMTHGLSNRLHGNTAGLSGNMARGMGEGWSDFYSLALLSEPADDLCGIYPVGGYVTYLITQGFTANHYYGIRRFPTARINCAGPNGRPHNPLTFRYINSNCSTLVGTTATNPNSAFPRGPVGSATCDQVHNLGEIWSSMLWEVRGVLIEQHGAAEGNRRALQYITDGMKLAPLNPTFLQERDAIIAAAFAANPSDVKRVREGFRRRGMGFSASIQNAGTGSNNTIVTEAFDLPNVQIIDPFSVSDAPGDNDGFPEAGEKVFLKFAVTNQTGDTITNAFVNADGGTNVNLGTLINGQTVQVQILYKIPRNALCGGLHQVTLNAGSDVGTQTPVLKQFRIGLPVGGEPVTFSNNTAIAIPGAAGQTSGAASPYPSTINVSGLSGTKNIRITLFNILHTFPGDIDMLLEGPGGQRYILLSDSGGGGDVNNLTFSLSDGAEAQPSTSQWTAGDFKPYNSGANDPFDPPAPTMPYFNAAPAGSDTLASVFGTNGAMLNGNWKLWIDDDAGGDSGSITGGWSITFESGDYACPTILNSPRADFDGDGKTDLSVFRPTEGNWYLNRSFAGFTAINWGVAGDVLVPGDYDGDNITDTAIKRGGDWYILRSCDNTTVIVNWGLSTDIAVPGDYNGDLKTDYAVFRPSEGNWYILRSDGGNVIFNWGISTDIPIVGDFDGDGRTDFTVYRDGVWYLNQSAAGNKTVIFGLSSDLPVPADYDGDGRDDTAVFRPSDGYWYIRRSSNNAVDYVRFGLSSDIPVPGDYDGDGRDDQAVYRSGTWYLNQSTAGFAGANFGLASDVPVPRAYIP